MNQQEKLQPASASMSPQPSPELQDEFTLLMSLHLDGLLDEAEISQFEAYMQRYPRLARQWREWQHLHERLVAEPHVLPPVDFVSKVEQSLVQQGRRRQLWQGMALGILILVLWGGLFATVAGLGALMLVNDGGWLNDMIHQLAFLSSTLGYWLRTGRTLISTLVDLPQAFLICSLYITVAVILLSLWIRFLRRTTASESPLLSS
jgi:hypothetical protein